MTPERREVADRREDSTAVQIAQLEGILRGVRDDIKDIKEASSRSLEIIDTRLAKVENDVRGLENREIRRNAIDDERRRIAAENAIESKQQRDEIQRKQISRRDMWLAVAAILFGCIATVLGAMIASGRIF